MPEDITIGIEPRAKLTVLYTGSLRGSLDRMAYISPLVSERRAMPNPVLLLDCGNWSRGTRLCDENNGKPMAEALEYVGYDAVCLGEDELSRGMETLSELAAMVRFPLLSCNVRGDIPGGIEAFAIVEKKGLRLAILGVSPMTNIPERQCYMVMPEEGIEDSLKHIEKEHTDLLVLISALDIEENRELSRRFPSLDVIVGCHPPADEPEEIGKTLLVGGGGEYLGSLSLDLGATVSLRGRFPE